MKGTGFFKIQEWYKCVIESGHRLAELLDEESDHPSNIALAMSIIKCGLYSPDPQVAKLCCSAILKIYEEARAIRVYYGRDQDPEDGLRDWFISAVGAHAKP